MQKLAARDFECILKVSLIVLFPCTHELTSWAVLYARVRRHST